MWIGRGVTQQAGFGFLGKARGAHANNFQNHVFKGYIRILLIKTNSMIYICRTKHGGKGVVCMLAVRDDELNVGDIEDMSSELAEGRDTRGKALGSHTEQNRTHGNTWGTGP